MFTDSHCHLDEFENPEEIASNAKKEGVKRIIACSVDLKSMQKSKKLSKIDGIFPCFGIHPANALKMNNAEIEKAFEFIEKNKKICYGIGETGLDFKYAETPEQKLKQIELFKRQIELAKKLNLPIIVHSRMARKECIELLENSKIEKVLLHWFSSGENLLKKAFEKNYFISIGPSVLFNGYLSDFVKKSPLQNLLLETDSPVEFAGEKALPQWIPKIAEKISQIKEIDLKEIELNCEKNAEKLFNFKQCKSI